jgi:pyruvate-formate lyase-activating enzyme
MSGNVKKPNPDTFCVYPWVEQVVQSSGKVGFCCVAKGGGVVKKDGGGVYRAGRDKLSEAWNSQHMREIRKGMIEGEHVPGCELCYFQESIGKKSYREMHNDEWMRKARKDVEARVESSQRNDFKVEKEAFYLDLRLGNLCNLRCRSCNSYNSSQIYKETIQLLDSNVEYKNFFARYNGDKQPPATAEWFESDEFWDEVINSIPNLRKVYLTGGETTLIEKNYKFMQACIDSGHAKNIFLMFNINCTNVQDKFLSYLPHFQFVLVNASIDGVGPANEYIRDRSRWETIDKNFRKLVELPRNVQVGVTPVIQVYNILGITDLLDYVESVSNSSGRDINVDFLYATDPPYINPQILPASIKAEAVARLELYKKKSRTYQSQPYLKNSIDSCINLLSEHPEADMAKLRDFADYTRMLDVNRKQSIHAVFPELAQRLEAEGISFAAHPEVSNV